MWALIDCNSFFCSVEKVFHPGLNGKPVCVLSSNDGNIVALTPEAKALGLHRGDPVFKVKSILEANKVNIFSSNLMLYAAMSRRILSILRKEIMQVENYSIDESFCNLHGYEKMGPLDSFMRNIVEKIRLYTDIPVSVGIAPSKTLAKMGSKYAKQYTGYRSVCLIDTEEKRRKALELFRQAAQEVPEARQAVRRLEKAGRAQQIVGWLLVACAMLMGTGLWEGSAGDRIIWLAAMAFPAVAGGCCLHYGRRQAPPLGRTGRIVLTVLGAVLAFFFVVGIVMLLDPAEAVDGAGVWLTGCAGVGAATMLLGGLRKPRT